MKEKFKIDLNGTNSGLPIIKGTVCASFWWWKEGWWPTGDYSTIIVKNRCYGELQKSGICLSGLCKGDMPERYCNRETQQCLSMVEYWWWPVRQSRTMNWDFEVRRSECKIMDWDGVSGNCTKLRERAGMKSCTCTAWKAFHGHYGVSIWKGSITISRHPFKLRFDYCKDQYPSKALNT